MFARRRGAVRRDDAEVSVPDSAAGADDPIMAFAEWALQRADGICWIALDGDLDDGVQALASDLPELARSAVRWSGAGVLPESGAEWFAFQGGGRAVLVFAMTAAGGSATRQLAVLGALARHGAYVIAGGRTPAPLRTLLQGTRGVPVWELGGTGRPAPAASLAA